MLSHVPEGFFLTLESSSAPGEIVAPWFDFLLSVAFGNV